jgi:hypothetical protein
MPDLTSAGAVALWLSMDASSTAKAQSALATLVTATSADFLRAIDRTDFMQGAYSEVREGDGGTRLALRHWPIQSIASLTIGGTSVAEQASPTSSGWYIDSLLDPERLNQLYLGGGAVFTDAAQVVVNYTAGYPAVPNDVAQAVIEWVADRYKGRPGSNVASQRSAGGDHVTYEKKEGAMPATTALVIERYKRVWPTLDRRNEDRAYRVTRINRTYTTVEK